MDFFPIASSSKGNAYVIKHKGVSPLLLEAGIPIRKIRENEHINFSLSGIAGCLISHEHMDHAKAVNDLLKAGVYCAMSLGTAGALGVVNHHRTMILKSEVVSIIGGWNILPFALKHDASEPLGFIVGYGSECLLFIPDTAYVIPTFPGISIVVIECNHSEEILTSKILNGSLLPVVGRRIRRNHMSLETVIGMLRVNDLSRCNQIWLIHLSDGNSDERAMIRAVQEATGITTKAAE